MSTNNKVLATAATKKETMDPEKKLGETERKDERTAIGGWAGWFFARLRSTRRTEPRLQLLERITLAPRQSLSLVEADGKRMLVATSADGGPAFYPLDSCKPGARQNTAREDSRYRARLSW